MYSFKEILRIKREEKGLSMEGLSKKAGLEKGAVKNIEYGRSIHPRIDTVQKLASALECSPFVLLPPEWSNTKINELDVEILGEALNKILSAKSLLKGGEPPLSKEDCMAVVVLYNKFIRSSNTLNKNNVI